MIIKACKPRKGTKLIIVMWGLLLTLALSGCLEQVQTTRIASGSLSNFLLHLENGELDDARAYFAPGLVTPSAALDISLKDASERLQGYEVRNRKSKETNLAGGEKSETIYGEIRAKRGPGTPTPGPDAGWQQSDIVTARMIERGPGWRILDFQLKCCTKP